MTRGWILFFSRRSEMCNMWSEYLSNVMRFSLGQPRLPIHLSRQRPCRAPPTLPVVGPVGFCIKLKDRWLLTSRSTKCVGQFGQSASTKHPA